MSRLWHRWVAFWAEEEHPRSLALVRICLGSVLLWEFLEIWRLDLVVAMFGVQEVGGLSNALERPSVPLAYQLLEPTVFSAQLLHVLTVLAALCFVAGFLSRFSAAALLLLWAQQADILPASDRGIDTLCRDVLLIFVFARSGATWSLDAMIRTGTWEGDGGFIKAGPRRLITLQLVAIYFLAGIQKSGVHWWPAGNFAALYFILQDPAIARFPFAWLENQPWFFLTQVGTIGTLVFQISYPLVFLWIHYRDTPDQPGWLRAFANRWHLDLVWIVTGASFHLGLAATTELGIFPWAMLAMYPAWIRPQGLGHAITKLRAYLSRGTQAEVEVDRVT